MVTFRSPDEDDFGSILGKVLATSLASALAQQGVSQGLGYAIDRAKAPDPVAAANEANLVRKQNIAAKALESSGLPGLEQGRLLMENFATPEFIFQDQPSWSEDRGSRLPKEPTPPLRTSPSSPDFTGPLPEGPAGDEAQRRQFYWQAKRDSSNALTNRLNRPKVMGPSPDPEGAAWTGGRDSPLTIKTGSPLEAGAERNPEAYAWATKGKGQKEQEFKTFLEKLRGENRLDVAKTVAAAADERQDKELDYKRDKLKQDLEIWGKRLDAINKNIETKRDAFGSRPQFLLAKAYADQADILLRSSVGIDGVINPGLKKQAEAAAQKSESYLKQITDESGAAGGGGGSSGEQEISDETVREYQKKSPALRKMSLEEAREYLKNNKRK